MNAIMSKGSISVMNEALVLNYERDDDQTIPVGFDT